MVIMNKKDTLWQTLCIKRIFNSHEVRRTGFDIYYDSADRIVRKWAEEGKLRRIPIEECFSRGLIKEGNARIGWWEIV